MTLRTRILNLSRKQPLPPQKSLSKSLKQTFISHGAKSILPCTNVWETNKYIIYRYNYIRTLIYIP